MKKKILAVLTMAAMLAGTMSMTAMAEEVTDQAPAGQSEVDARILGQGDVSYIISIPDKIDFGTLQMPTEAGAENRLKNVGFTVEAKKIEGLNTTTSRVAVLVQDSETEGLYKFSIRGISDTNKGKTLDYQILNSQGKDLTNNSTAYQNGYVLAGFGQEGESVKASLSLDQDQLLADPYIANWAGLYQGKLNFYTAIGSIKDFSSAAPTNE